MEFCLPKISNISQLRKWGVGYLSLLLALAVFHLLCNQSAFAEESTTLGSGAPPLPHIKSLGPIIYPDQAKRLDLEGSVLVEFGIDAAGKTTGVTVIRSDHPLFAKTAIRGLSATTFDVPVDWANENVGVRYQVVMVFCLPPSNQVTVFPESPYNPIIVAGNHVGSASAPTIPGTCKARQ